MISKSIGAAVAALLVAQPALSEPASSSQALPEAGSCIQRSPGEEASAFDGRTRRFCEIRWSDLVTRGSTGRWTHPDFMSRCLQRCRIGDLSARQVPGGVPPDTGPILAVSAGVALAIKAATTNPGAQPASP